VAFHLVVEVIRACELADEKDLPEPAPVTTATRPLTLNRLPASIGVVFVADILILPANCDKLFAAEELELLQAR
jgi:hypothetical protein